MATTAACPHPIAARPPFVLRLRFQPEVFEIGIPLARIFGVLVLKTGTVVAAATVVACGICALTSAFR